MRELLNSALELLGFTAEQLSNAVSLLGAATLETVVAARLHAAGWSERDIAAVRLALRSLDVHKQERKQDPIELLRRAGVNVDDYRTLERCLQVLAPGSMRSALARLRLAERLGISADELERALTPWEDVARAIGARIAELRGWNRSPARSTPARRRTTVPVQERIARFVSTCNLLRNAPVVRRRLAGFVTEFWGRDFTLKDLASYAGTSRIYAIRLVRILARLKLIKIVQQGSRGRGRVTVYRLREPWQDKKVTLLSHRSQQSEEYSACGAPSANREERESKENKAHPTPCHHPPPDPTAPTESSSPAVQNHMCSAQKKRRCPRVWRWLEACPQRADAPIRRYFPFWRDLVYWSRDYCTRLGLERAQVQLVASLVARWIVGKPIRRAFEFVRELLLALARLVRRTVRQLLWTVRYYANLVFRNVRLQQKWYMRVQKPKSDGEQGAT